MKTYLKKCKHGEFILIHGDMISEYVNLLGEWCEGEVDLFKLIIPENGNVVEVGSNIEMHTVPIAKRLKHGRMFCFEPQRVVYQILCGNIAINNLTNVHAFNKGCSHESGSIKIQSGSYDKPWNYGAFSLETGFSNEQYYSGATNDEDVELVALDEVSIFDELNRIDLIKIDAEGFDEKMGTLILDKKPDAIFAVDEYAAVAAMKFCLKNGFHVPNDISIIGFADGLWSRRMTPSLSTVSQHAPEIGQKTAELIIKRIEEIPDSESERIFETVIIKTELRKRDSVRKLF